MKSILIATIIIALSFLIITSMLEKTMLRGCLLTFFLILVIIDKKYHL